MTAISWTEIIGLCAGFLTTLAFVPQLTRVWRTQSVDDISLPTFVLFFVGTLGWLVYGWLTQSLSVLVANGITLLLAFGILVGIVHFRRRQKLG